MPGPPTAPPDGGRIEAHEGRRDCVRLILVRHAQSEANRDQVGLGRIDSPLTALGERQTEAVAAALAGEPVRRHHH